MDLKTVSQRSKNSEHPKGALVGFQRTVTFEVRRKKLTSEQQDKLSNGFDFEDITIAEP